MVLLKFYLICSILSIYSSRSVHTHSRSLSLSLSVLSEREWRAINISYKYSYENDLHLITRDDTGIGHFLEGGVIEKSEIYNTTCGIILERSATPLPWYNQQLVINCKKKNPPKKNKNPPTKNKKQSIGKTCHICVKFWTIERINVRKKWEIIKESPMKIKNEQVKLVTEGEHSRTEVSKMRKI